MQMFYLVSTDKGFEWPSHLHTCCLEEVMDSCRVWAKARSQCEAIHKQPLMIRVCIWFQVLPKSSIPTPRECSTTDKKQKTWLLQTLQKKGLKRHTHTRLLLSKWRHYRLLFCSSIHSQSEHIWVMRRGILDQWDSQWIG